MADSSAADTELLPQLRRFLLAVQFTAGALGVLGLALGALTRDVAVIAFGVVLAALAAAHVITRRYARRGRVIAALVATSIAGNLMLVAVTVIMPQLFPVSASAVMIALTATLLFTDRPMPTWVPVVTGSLSVLLVGLGLTLRRLYPPAPPIQLEVFVPAAVLANCFLLLFVVWQFRRRVEDAFARLQAANAALEQRVEARTGELTKANAELERLLITTGRQGQYVETLLQASPVAIVTLDTETRVQSWNEAAEHLFGWTSEEATGRSIDDLITNEQQRAEALAYSQRLTEGEDVQFVTCRCRQDGSLVDVQLRAAPVTVDGKRVGGLAIYSDVSELELARKAAEEADRAKSAFLATMSHEIRTPMNAIIGMTGLLLDTNLRAEQREYAEIVRGSAESLLTIINDILDFSKIAAGQLDLERVPFNLRTCVESALDLAAATLDRSRPVELVYVWSPGTPEGVVGDVTRLRQILLNLLSNALKFTERGEVVLTVGSRPRDGEHELHFVVRDTGIGIPPDRMGKLFQSFSQLDPSTTRRYGGTGLGLVISKRLAELMGGSMEVTSEVGVGTTCRFSVVMEPADVVPGDVRLPREQAEIRGRRLLVVDDNPTNRRILVELATAWGLRVRATGAPSEAIAWLETGEPFDAAILDMQMPEMDGLELSERIRLRRGPEQLPLILCSSLGRREPAETAGFAAHLTKPLKPSQLLDTLLEVVTRAAPERAGPAPSEAAAARPARGLRVLLAEDNAVNQKLALRLLERLGLRADVAGNGQEVLDALSRQHYDVVLMDVQMPELDGVEATRRIREGQTSANGGPWIIAMTANAMQGDREAYLAAGMDDYVSKPIRPGELAGALARVPSGGRVARRSEV